MKTQCESCGLAIDNGCYCSYCVDAAGQLQAFEVRFERMVQWAMNTETHLSRVLAEQQTIAYMARMPAWAKHPEVLARSGQQHGT